MPPTLEPAKSKIDGLAFLGLSLARRSDVGNPASQTHQTSFDFNEVQDREYKYLASTNDDGWLLGGGEPGPPLSYKLRAPDSAHVEIMRVGTFNKNWGGLPVEEIVDAFKSAKILVPEITVVPTAVVENEDLPPELEIRFDMEKSSTPYNTETELPPLPVNWQLRFLHNQLFRLFEYPSRFCPGAFHSTIVRKADFRDDDLRDQYFDKCRLAIQRWTLEGPKPLLNNSTASMNNIDPKIERVKCPKKKVAGGELGSSSEYMSGLWLFTDRNTITHLFEPNFLPPYDTPAKRKVILDVLSEEWDEQTLSWKPCSVPIDSMAYETPQAIAKRNPKVASKMPFGFESFFETLCGPISDVSVHKKAIDTGSVPILAKE